MINQHRLQSIPNGVMFNAYPDSIGQRLSDTIKMLQLPEFKEVFSLFYILPTFFNSDLDRGFSIIDYNLNPELVSAKDLKALQELHIMLKFDIVLNHLSVASAQFKDLLQNGEHSNFKDFFINWNSFWEGKGTKNEEGIIVPEERYLNKLFMRKSGLPILKVPFPDGSEQPYWNTFYQEIKYNLLKPEDLKSIKDLSLTRESDLAKVAKLKYEIEGMENQLSSLPFYAEYIEKKQEKVDIQNNVQIVQNESYHLIKNIVEFLSQRKYSYENGESIKLYIKRTEITDVYNLYDEDNKLGIAHVPNMKTSLILQKEIITDDKYKVECLFNKKFNKYIPLNIIN